MGKKSLLLLLSTVLFLACQKEEQPANLLPKEKMSSVLKELHIAEAYVNINYMYSDSSKYLYTTMRDSILKAKGVEPLTFDSSMAYYKRHIKDFDEIYAATIDSLSLLEGLSK